jgi:hypothetical protein
MSIGFAFWMLMILWLIFGFFSWRGYVGAYGWVGNTLLLFILFALLGWHDFGPPIHG